MAGILDRLKIPGHKALAIEREVGLYIRELLA